MADFTEQQVYEALGLGGKEQEIADPAPGSETDPAPETDPQTNPEAPADGAGGPSKSRKSPPLPRRERSRNRMAERLGRREREAESRTTREPAGNRP